jgi:hypothetical protein
MAQNAVNIHIGPARIWLGVTPPGASPPGTWMGHTNGVPATGVEVGHTEGEATFMYRSDKMEILSEQAFGVADLAVIGETSELRFTAQERTADNMRLAFDSYGHDTTGGTIGKWGGGTGFTPLTQAIFLSSPRRDNPAKFEFLLIYKGINTNGITIRYARTAKSLMEFIIKPIVDTTRAAGDQMFQWRREAAA